MSSNPQPEPSFAAAAPAKPSVKIFGVGNAGISVLQQLLTGDKLNAQFAAVDTDGAVFGIPALAETFQLESKLLRGLGSGGDPERGRAMAEERFADLKSACEGISAVFIVAGLGGGAGTGIAPVLARAAREAGALAMAFVVTPFDCEGGRRQRLAEFGLDALKETADAVVCLPNQRIFKLIDENTSVIETFKFSAGLLAEGVRAFWALLAHKGLIELHFSEVCDLLRGQHAESSFAVAEAMGATRSRDVGEKLITHPMLEGGQLLSEAETVLISIMGGTDLTMAEVNRVVQQIGSHCENAQVMMGAAVDPAFNERLVVVLIAARKGQTPAQPDARGALAEGLQGQLLRESETPRPNSRILPPPPAITPEQAIARQNGSGRSRKPHSRLRQQHLPLEIISKGRFDKSEPTIHKGEDLDVPTYIRRGISLN
jgi:cell division protein FtsZ